ncbi:MAG: hypothetical protein VYA27_09265 [Verrucomicrobiota bacterium]|nr:hypothetical protein [Verrucomicrobiota bacterium]
MSRNCLSPYAIAAASQLRRAEEKCHVPSARASVLISVTTGMLRWVVDAVEK